MKSEYIQILIRIGIFLFFILILYKIIDLKLLKEAIQNVRFEIILIAILLYFINIAIRAYRLEKILNKNRKRLSLKDAYIITFIGAALNLIVPASLGDIAKSYYGYKIYGIREEMLAASIVDKLFALCSLFLLGAVSGVIMGYFVLGTISLFSAIFTFIPLTFPNLVPWNVVNTILRIFKKSLNLEKLLTVFTLPYMLKIFIFGISVGGWLFNCIYFYVLCSAFPVEISLGYVILIMPMFMIVRLFPFTVSVFGPKEIVVVYFFSIIGINPTLAVLISLSSNVISSFIPGTLGFFMILVLGHNTRKRTPKEEGRSEVKGEIERI